MATNPIDFSSIGGKPVQSVDFSSIGGKPVAASETSEHKIDAGPKPWTVPWLKAKLYNVADSLSEGLPAAGATAGAVIGGTAGAPTGPGAAAAAVGGAGIGGMAGEALKQHVRRALGFEVPQTSEEAAQEITKQGVIQGGTQAVSEALPIAAGPLKNSALKQYERAMAPTTRINKAITEKIAPEMIDRGVTGSLPTIEAKATSAADELRPQLNAAYSAMHPNQTAGSGMTILNDLENLKGKYVVQGQVANPQAVKAISDVQEIVKQYGPNIDPESLRQLKQIFDEPVAAKGGYAGADLATQYAVKTQKAAANSIRGILNSASPDVSALNKEMSFWLDVKRVVNQSGLRKTGQDGGLLKTLAPLASAAAGAGGYAAGGATTGLEAAFGTAAATAVAQAVRTPLWRTVSAVEKNRLANALASGSAGDVVALLSRLGFASLAASHHQSPTPSQPQQEQQ